MHNFTSRLQVLRTSILAILGVFIFEKHTAANWNEFRGPLGTGHIPNGQALPSEWSESKNVDWKVALPGRAWSSPVLSGDTIWLTTADETGNKLTTLAVDAKNGKIVFEKQLFHIEKPQYAHKFNTYASPTPIVEGDRVYLTWGSPGTACIDTKTKKVLWKRGDFECDHFRGSGSRGPGVGGHGQGAGLAGDTAVDRDFCFEFCKNTFC